MTNWIAALMERLGYTGIALLMILENLFPPIPSELIMPLAGYSARSGQLSLIGIVLAGTAGSVAGALPLYFLGRQMGRERLERWADTYGRWIAISGKDIRRAQHWFDRHGTGTVFYGRLVPGFRSLISIPAGVAGMPPLTFLLYSALGMGIWSTLLTLLGWILAENYEWVSEVLGPTAWIVLGIVIAVTATLLIRRRVKGLDRER